MAQILGTYAADFSSAGLAAADRSTIPLSVRTEQPYFRTSVISKLLILCIASSKNVASTNRKYDIAAHLIVLNLH